MSDECLVFYVSIDENFEHKDPNFSMMNKAMD